jgi:hypothetical protein
MHKEISVETQLPTPTYMTEKDIWLKYLQWILGR